MTFPRYVRSKSSGERWLGEIPEHWEVKPLKKICAIVAGSTPKSDVEEYWVGDVVWVTPADLSQLSRFDLTDSKRHITQAGLNSCGTTLVPAGSIVLSTRAPIGSIAIASSPLCTNQGCKSLVPNSDSVSRFYAYLLSAATDELNLRGQGTTFLELSGTALAAFEVVVPPTREQRIIATFLDREIAKIDALIQEQKRLIELLKEKRQAVISQAVTKGLDATVPMKHSGVEWLGKVPEHWAVSQMRYVVRARTTITYGIVQAGPHVEDGIPYIKTSDMSGSELPLCGYAKTSPEIDAAYTRSKVETGDLVIAIRASVGKCLPVPPELNGANLTQGTAKIAPGESTRPDYLLAYINSVPLQTFLSSMSKGATFKEITLETLRKTVALVPPIEEQREIAARANALTREFQALIDTADKAETLLLERRSTLISAAVTGKIDVRSFVAKPEATLA